MKEDIKPVAFQFTLKYEVQIAQRRCAGSEILLAVPFEKGFGFSIIFNISDGAQFLNMGSLKRRNANTKPRRRNHQQKILDLKEL